MKGNLMMTLTVAALAAVLGFFAGRRSSGDGALDAGGSERRGLTQASKTGRSGGGAGGRSGSVEAGRLRGSSPEVTIRGVVRNLELSPMLTMDFDAMFGAYEAIRGISPEGLQAALVELDAMEANQQTKMILQMMLINRWAKQDGQGAVEFAMEQSQPMLKMMGMMGGLSSWAREDPETAYAWYQDNRDEMKGGMMGRGQMDGIFFTALAQRDMDGAFARLETLDKTSQKRALNAMAGQMAADPVKRNQFLKKLEGIDDKAMRDEAVEGMVSTWAWQDPQGAARFIEEGEFDSKVEKKLMNNLARSWANSDPEAAMTWRVESADDDERGTVIAEGFGNWAAQDPKGAEKWLETQPDAVRTDELYRTTSQRLTWQNEYEKAVSYADKIEEESVRTDRMRDVYTHWNGNDEAEAREWLEGLDEPTRTAIETGGQIGDEPVEQPRYHPMPADGEE